MEDIAVKIRQRTNALNISISQLCEMAGVHRDWYEKTKKRTPKSVIAYLKIIATLAELEKEKLS